MSERRRRVARAVSDVWRVNRAFVTSSAFRAAVQEGLRDAHRAAGPSALQLRERAAAPSAVEPYAELTPVSTALAAIGHSAAAPALNLVVPDYEPGAVFAGLHTAARTASKLARAHDLPVRLVILSEARSHTDADAIRADLTARTEGTDWSVVFRPELIALPTHRDDVWVVTHWTTAHAAGIACRVGAIDPVRVVYLVQDHEPGFVPMSTERVLASATYRERFLLVVNTSTVAEALRRHEGVLVERELTFAPEIDADRLAALASDRGAVRPRRVLFYGRPSKPRNMFALGVAALKVAAQRADSPVEWVSAGEVHDDFPLGNGHVLQSLGTVSWDGYFDELRRAGVVLSLQASPHPSHPPLEAALSGAIAVTNDSEGTRRDLLPNLLAVDPDPLLLGDAIVRALAEPLREVRDLTALGRPLDDVVAEVAARFRP